MLAVAFELRWLGLTILPFAIFSADEPAQFESNFPVDSGSCTYAVLWNALKRLAVGYSASEKTALFSGTAARVYRLAL